MGLPGEAPAPSNPAGGGDGGQRGGVGQDEGETTAGRGEDERDWERAAAGSHSRHAVHNILSCEHTHTLWWGEQLLTVPPFR